MSESRDGIIHPPKGRRTHNLFPKSDTRDAAHSGVLTRHGCLPAWKTAAQKGVRDTRWVEPRDVGGDIYGAWGVEGLCDCDCQRLIVTHGNQASPASILKDLGGASLTIRRHHW
jgi:hypothetical protein